MIRSSVLRLAALGAVLLLAGSCGDEPEDYTVAREYWAQPDSVVIGIGQASDMKAISRDEVWIADLVSTTILVVAPGEDRYRRIGMGDQEPVEVQLPAKLAVAREFGLAAFDAETQRVDLFTLEGEFIRGFEPGFVPAVMSFSREPLGFTFAVAAADPVDPDATGADADSDAETPPGADAATDTAPSAEAEVLRRPVIIRTDLQGGRRDTLLSPSHGPEELRTAVARQGETSISPSRTGMWVWTRTSPTTAFHLSPRGTRLLDLRAEAEDAIGMMADPELDMVWMLHEGEEGTRYAAYDARLASDLEPRGQEADAFLGTRTVTGTFAPGVIHDGVVMGVRRHEGALLATAYDLNADRFERADDGD